LDEIGKMEIGSQNKLLRFLTEERRSGLAQQADASRCPDHCRTNENLESLVEEQKYCGTSTSGWPLSILNFHPSGKDRRYPLLADYFLEQYSRKHRKMIVGFEKSALDFLLTANGRAM